MFKKFKHFLRCATTTKDDKIKYLERKVYDYYYTFYLTRLSSGSVNLPDFIIREQVKNLASSATHFDIQNVIKEDRINQCFAKAIL